MGSSRSKLTSRDYMLRNILDILYDVDTSRVTHTNIAIHSGIICIEATIDSKVKTFEQQDGSMTDMLDNIMNDETILYNPYVELEDCVKKYNDHIKMINILNSQGL